MFPRLISINTIAINLGNLRTGFDSHPSPPHPRNPIADLQHIDQIDRGRNRIKLIKASHSSTSRAKMSPPIS